MLKRTDSSKGEDTTVSIPIHLVDLPGYEELDPEEFPDTEFIQSTINNSLNFIKDRTNTQFATDFKLVDSKDLKKEIDNLRVISFLVLNRRGGNEHKLNAIKAASFGSYLKGPALGKNLMLIKPPTGKTYRLRKTFAPVWEQFLALKTALARSYFDLQKDQRLFLDMMREKTGI